MPSLPDQVTLLVSLPIFLASAAAVVFMGIQLAKYGDALATLTGWGHLFVGSILVALATSLPELSNNITAARIDNPQLALGNVVGANMINMFTISVVALLFGGRRFLQRVAPEQGYLIALAAILTGMVLILAAWHAVFPSFLTRANLWQIGISSVALLVVYIIGMRIIYQKRPMDSEEEDADPGMTLHWASLMFSLVSIGVIIAGVFLAQSADWIAESTGISSGIVGILAVSIVTTMPEASAAVAAARLGVPDLGVAGLYGSCVFNVTILAYADPFYRNGIIMNCAAPEHFVSGAIAVGLIVLGGLLLWGRNRFPQPVIIAGLSLAVIIYLAGAAGSVGAAWLPVDLRTAC